MQRNRVWQDELSLWQDAAAKSPLMPRVHVHLGNALSAAGDRSQAMIAFTKAVNLDPEHRAAHTNLGNIAYELALEESDPRRRKRHLGTAQAAYQKVLLMDAGHKEALNNLGSVYLIQQDHTKAMELYDHLVTIHPNFADGHYNRGQAALGLDKLEEAQLSFANNVRLAPAAAGYVALGQVYVKTDNLDAAARAFEQAAALDPTVATHQYNLAAVLLSLGERRLQTGDQDEAMRLWSRARNRLGKTLELEPVHPRALRRLAQLEGRLK